MYLTTMGMLMMLPQEAVKAVMGVLVEVSKVQIVATDELQIMLVWLLPALLLVEVETDVLVVELVILLDMELLLLLATLTFMLTLLQLLLDMFQLSTFCLSCVTET